MSLDAVTERLRRITRALEEHRCRMPWWAGRAVALLGGHQGAAAVRTTKDVDPMVRREDRRVMVRGAVGRHGLSGSPGRWHVPRPRRSEPLPCCPGALVGLRGSARV